MNRDGSEDILWLGWTTSAAMLALAAWLAFAGLPAPPSKDWPAWVQAISSIIAIVAVALIAAGEHNRVLKAQTEAERELIDTLVGIAAAAASQSAAFAARANIIAGLGTSPRSAVESFERHCAKSRTTLERLLTGRSAPAAVLLAAADLSATLEFKPSDSMLKNPTLAHLEGEKLAGEFEILRDTLLALRPET